MPSRRIILRAGPLVVESRLTTRDLGGLDAGDGNRSASERADDDGMAVLEPSTPDHPADPVGVLLDELDQRSSRGGERDGESLAEFGAWLADTPPAPRSLKPGGAGND